MLFAGTALLGAVAVPSAASADSSSATLSDAMLTATATPPAISFGSQDVAFSGALTGVADLGQEPVTLTDTDTGVSQSLTTTNDDGTFAAAPVHVLPDSYMLSVTADATTVDSDPIQITVDQDQTMLTASVKPKDLKYGRKGTLSGTAFYQDGSVWRPLADTAVQVNVGTHKATVQTSSAGKFSWPIPTTFGPKWAANVGSSQFFGASKITGSLTVAIPLKARSFAARLTPLGQVDTSGCLQISAAHYSPPTGKAEIQYARGAKGPWKSLGRVSLGHGTAPSCHRSDESSFKAALVHRLADAYYRADYPGGVHFTRAVSKVVHSSLRTTRITSVQASPRHVRTGGDVTITGRLWKHASEWLPYGGRKVNIIYRFPGHQTWHPLATVRTAASGRFHLTFTDGATATLSAIYLGDRTHLWSQGRDVKVTVSNAMIRSFSPGQLRWISHGAGELAAAPGKSLAVHLK
jgi:hypothetical protein